MNAPATVPSIASPGKPETIDLLGLLQALAGRSRLGANARLQTTGKQGVSDWLAAQFDAADLLVPRDKRPLRLVLLGADSPVLEGLYDSVSRGTSTPSSLLHVQPPEGEAGTLRALMLPSGAGRPIHLWHVPPQAAEAAKSAEEALVRRADIVVHFLPAMAAEQAAHLVEHWADAMHSMERRFSTLSFMCAGGHDLVIEALTMVSIPEGTRVLSADTSGTGVGAIWAQLMRTMREHLAGAGKTGLPPTTAQAVAPTATPTPTQTKRAPGKPVRAALPEEALSPAVLKALEIDPPIEPINLGNLSVALEALMQLDGAVAVAMVDANTGKLLGQAGGGAVNLELAATGNAEVVRAKLKTMLSLGIEGTIEDILITLQVQYHLIRLLPGTDLFLYLVLNRAESNLALARYKLSEQEKGMQL